MSDFIHPLPDCMHMEMVDGEGPFTVHMPPSVFDVVADMVNQYDDGGVILPLEPWFDGGVPVYVEREDVILRYAFRMPESRS